MILLCPRQVVKEMREKEIMQGSVWVSVGKAQ